MVAETNEQGKRKSELLLLDLAEEFYNIFGTYPFFLPTIREIHHSLPALLGCNRVDIHNFDGTLLMHIRLRLNNPESIF